MPGVKFRLFLARSSRLFSEVDILGVDDNDELAQAQQVMAEFQASIAERAKSRTSRKHHYLPAFYLGQWAEQGPLAVYRVQSKATFRASPKKIARITDFNTVSGLENFNGVPDNYFEELYAQLEDEAAPIFREMSETARLDLDEEERYVVALCLSTQSTRTPGFLNGIGAYDLTPKSPYQWVREREWVRRYFAATGGDKSETSNEKLDRIIRGASESRLADLHPQDQAHKFDLYLTNSFQWANQIVQHPWVLLRSVNGGLLTSDQPVLCLGVRRWRRTEIIAGSDAYITVFPVSPGVLLVILPESREGPHLRITWPINKPLSTDEVAGLNAEMAAHASEFLFGTSQDDFRGLPDLSLEPEASRQAPLDRSRRRIYYNRWSRGRTVPNWPLERWSRPPFYPPKAPARRQG